MTDPTVTIDTHLAGYCEPDPAKRLGLLSEVWAATGELIDPPMEGTGPEGIAALVDVVLEHYPAHRFERTTGVDAHHGYGRYGWALNAPDGTTSVVGVDIARFDEAGRLTQVVGFFGDAPAKDG